MKNLKVLALLSCVIFSATALAVNEGFYFQKQSLRMQSSETQFQKLKLRADGSFRTMEKATFEQKLVHGGQSSKTFKQRYFVDSSYATDANSPVFYIICGEWNCAGTGSYSYVEGLAKKLKAHLVALEHRYYGESLPTSKLTANNIISLDLASAVTDLATFQKFMMDEKGLKGQWVAVGGSYAGTLAAFYRLKHPELVVGALASSAPVLAKSEFSEYDAHVAKVINSSSCGNKVRQAVALIEKKLETPETSQAVKALFNSSDIPDDDDFLYAVADMLAAAVQYGRDKVFCDAMNSTPDLVAGYAKGGLTVLAALGAKPSDIALSVALKEDVTPNENMRQWMWQSCQEFGWFQVANGSGAGTSRSSRVDIGYHQRVCQRLFQRSMKADGSLNQDWYLPLLDPQTSHIIFTNGSNDPWLTLSVVPGGSGRNENFDLFMMDGSAHCNDLRAVTQLPSVMAAQTKMESIIRTWLK
ncbi:MAG TPA: alpha/beta fold hydrolase [Bacteriovoracaceae bacterium]|nr:alpha/beta fold hydrolase [Bacteriovoracaceae bacterium]